jgi:signal transduction histidine kinase/DNA-binding response OmpR family regulator
VADPARPVFIGELTWVRSSRGVSLRYSDEWCTHGFARIEAQRAEVQPRPTDLAALTIDLASSFRSMMEGAGLELRVDCPPLGAPVLIDADMWEKIVLNLLSNAFKFTFEGAITVELRSRDHRVELAVRDTGVGVPESEVPRLFERFHRVEGARSRTHEGSGIGLALVQELVKMHGGTVSVRSELGKGTAFTVSIPTRSAHLPQDRINARQTLQTTALGSAPFVEEALRWLPESDLPISDAPEIFDDPTVPPARILLADDNADMRTYLRRLMSKHWTVEGVADGEAALAAMRKDRFDLVVTDVMMPRVDGYQLLRTLRADPATASMPVIMVSARAGEEARLEAIGLGADDYLVKPFSARELVARVKSQLALASARRALEQVRDELYQLFMQAPAPICVIRGPELVFEMANALYEQVIGHREIVGKPMLVAMPELAGQGFDELLRNVMRTGVPYYARERLVRLDRRNVGDFEDTYFTFVYAPMHAVDGSIDRVMVFCMEVTDQVVARRTAESANRAKDEFLAMLGHELRNPLAPILTALQLMQLRDSEASKKERAIIERHVGHLVHLVDDLLDVARIARGSIELRRSHVELAEIIARSVEMTSPLIEQRRHSLEVSAPSRGLMIDGDPNRLAQIVSNLLTNAAKYTEPGGRMWVSAQREGNDVVMRVRDNGIGIAPDMLPRIFDLFAQEQQSLDRSQGGLGLGLAIVRNLVTMHGGTISAHSAGRGRGSEFIVRLPAVAGASATTTPTSSDAAAEQPTPDAIRILVVDDNADAADLLVEMLRQLGHVTAVAYDGPSALEVASQFRPEVALLDIGLPVMDGYEVGRRLRERSSNVLLVALTGYGQDSDRDRTRSAGFDVHIVKPITFDAVVSVLERVRN